MRSPNTEIIATPERGVTTAELAVPCEVMARSPIDAPRPTLRTTILPCRPLGRRSYRCPPRRVRRRRSRPRRRQATEATATKPPKPPKPHRMPPSRHRSHRGHRQSSAGVATSHPGRHQSRGAATEPAEAVAGAVSPPGELNDGPCTGGRTNVRDTRTVRPARDLRCQASPVPPGTGTTEPPAAPGAGIIGTGRCTGKSGAEPSVRQPGRTDLNRRLRRRHAHGELQGRPANWLRTDRNADRRLHGMCTGGCGTGKWTGVGAGACHGGMWTGRAAEARESAAAAESAPVRGAPPPARGPRPAPAARQVPVGAAGIGAGAGAAGGGAGIGAFARGDTTAGAGM